MAHPKVLELRSDQPHKEKWEKYFLVMYLDECKRLSLSPPQIVYEMSMKRYNENTLFSLEPKK